MSIDCNLVCTQVIRADFSPQDWSDRNTRYTICIESAIDNSVGDKDLDLAPWSYSRFGHLSTKQVCDGRGG